MSYQELISNSTNPIAQWLESIGLPQYEHNFKEQGYDLESIVSLGLNDDDFKALDINKRGHMNKINYSVAGLRQGVNPRGSGAGSVSKNTELQILSEILVVCKDQITSGLSVKNCWSVLQLAESLNNNDICELIWQFIDEHAYVVLFNEDFVTLPENLVLKLISRENVAVSEASLFLAASRWITANLNNSNSEKLFSEIRFGTFSSSELQSAEGFGVLLDKEFLYPAWRHLADPNLPKIKDEKYYTKRKGEIKQVKPSPIPVLTKYVASQSSVYSGLTGTYENLTDDKVNSPGAGTNYSANEWIQAEFPHPVFVSKIKMGAPTGPGFSEGGWASTSYVDGKQIKYSNDGVNWEVAIESTSGTQQTGISEFKLPAPVIARYWRIATPPNVNAYIAIGALLFE